MGNAFLTHAVAVVALFLLTFALPRTSLAAQNPPAQEPSPAPPSVRTPSGSLYVVEYSTAPMWKNAMIGDIVWNAAGRSADWSFDALTHDRFSRKSIRWFAARLARLWALDLPTAGYAFVWVHEYGHKTRANEAGFRARVVVSGSPWTLSDAHTEAALLGRPVAPGIYSAGIEATNVVARRIERRLFVSGTAHHTDLSALLLATSMGIGYVQRDLSPQRVRTGAIFQGEDPGDPTGYVVTLAERRFGQPTLQQMQDMAHGVRTGSWMNLVDYGLVTAGVGLFRDYLWRGDRSTPVRWLTIGQVSLIPSLRYELTPVGPERQIRSYVKVGPTVAAAHVRWSERVDAGRLVGAGVDYEAPPVGRWRPAVVLDAWKNPDQTFGGRVEARAAWSRTASDRWVLIGAVGGKGRGYLFGFPDRKRLYASVGAGLEF